MTPILRKRHQQTWWFLGLALIIIWSTSMITIHKSNTNQNQIASTPEKGIAISVKNGIQPHRQTVVLQLDQVPISPQTLVYLTDNENNSAINSQLLGRIAGRGSFEFPLDSIASAMPKKVIKGYDAIHQKELFTVVITTE